MMAKPNAVECFVFVDNSNLWIEGQKAEGKKLKDSDIDPRYRVDVGGLLDMVLDKYNTKRKDTQAFLYGSTPPPNDTLWEAIKKQQYKVKTFPRSISGKEKKVDVAMATAMTKVAMEKKYSKSTQQTIIIAVTGDKDLITPMEVATEIDLVTVDLWSWQDSMAREFYQLARKCKNFSVYQLDDVQERFSFKSYKSNRPQVASEKAIVIKNVPATTHFYKEIAKKLESMRRLFYISGTHQYVYSHKKINLPVEFPNSELEDVLSDYKSHNIGNEVCSYNEYLSSGTQPLQTNTEHNYSKEDSDVSNDTQDYEQSLSTDDDTSYTDLVGEYLRKDPIILSEEEEKEIQKLPGTVYCKYGIHCTKSLNCSYFHTEEEKQRFQAKEAQKLPRAARCMYRMHCLKALHCLYFHTEEEKQKFQANLKKRETRIRCMHGMHCIQALNCLYFHSEEDKQRFQAQGPTYNFKYWKTTLCNMGDQHITQHEIEFCRFAHSPADSWCLKCKKYGHLAKQCIIAR